MTARHNPINLTVKQKIIRVREQRASGVEDTCFRTDDTLAVVCKNYRAKWTHGSKVDVSLSLEPRRKRPLEVLLGGE